MHRNGDTRDHIATMGSILTLSPGVPLGRAHSRHDYSNPSNGSRTQTEMPHEGKAPANKSTIHHSTTSGMSSESPSPNMTVYRLADIPSYVTKTELEKALREIGSTMKDARVQLQMYPYPTSDRNLHLYQTALIRFTVVPEYFQNLFLKADDPKYCAIQIDRGDTAETDDELGITITIDHTFDAIKCPLGECGCRVSGRANIPFCQ